MCIYEDCIVRPYYNNIGETKALYCSQHRLEGMINVLIKHCIYEGCNTIPLYNYYKEGERKGLYCAKHKLEGMVDIKNKTCIYNNCKIKSNFNKPGEKKGLYCVQHKLQGMINVTSHLCLYEGCKHQPTFNKPGEKKGLYCAQHKLQGMTDVNHTYCIYKGCNIRPIYNKPDENKALYCLQHKLQGMINIKDKKCIYPECNTIPNYNEIGEKKKLYCVKHKLDEMININDNTCKSEWCSTQVRNKYDGYCLFCYMNLFPDKPVCLNYKTKEYSVVEYVKNKYPDFTWIADKLIKDGCSKRRPDLLLDLGYQVIIIEIDENQHINYDCSCENKRIMELSQDLNHRPIIFIRFNPDDYTSQGKNITSCWGNNMKGICVVKKSKKKEWEERLESLNNQISYWINPDNKTEKTIEIIQLYYDDEKT